MAKQPPEVNGIMELTEEEIAYIKWDLLNIVSNYVATDDLPYPTTQCIVATYNDNHCGKEINGDTASYVLGSEIEPVQPPVVEEPPVEEPTPTEPEPQAPPVEGTNPEEGV